MSFPDQVLGRFSHDEMRYLNIKLPVSGLVLIYV